MRFLTVRQLAQRWGVSVQAIYDRIARGTLACKHIGSLKVITLDQIERVESGEAVGAVN